jgi:UDP-N-acetylglucosamine 1-carboxyvinyltransferase
MAMLSLGEGGGEVVDRVFPERFAHVEQLNRLGGNILREGNRARVGEIHHFHGGQVSATDLRAGAALILAALTAGGVTVIHRAELIRRGYERLDEKLTALGADVTPGTEKKKAG